MTRRRRKRKRRKPSRIRVTCPDCRRSRTADPGTLLQAAADALTACQQAGIRLKLKHNAVYASAGYILPSRDGWVARTLQWSPFWPDDLDDDGDLS